MQLRESVLGVLDPELRSSAPPVGGLRVVLRHFVVHIVVVAALVRTTAEGIHAGSLHVLLCRTLDAVEVPLLGKLVVGGGAVAVLVAHAHHLSRVALTELHRLVRPVQRHVVVLLDAAPPVVEARDVRARHRVASAGGREEALCSLLHLLLLVEHDALVMVRVRADVAHGLRARVPHHRLLLVRLDPEPLLIRLPQQVHRVRVTPLRRLREVPESLAQVLSDPRHADAVQLAQDAHRKNVSGLRSLRPVLDRLRSVLFDAHTRKQELRHLPHALCVPFICCFS
mmetsp:Transcript_46101/g.108185  ORF Transcript_46101/g.108185 Transcript_46101/m.108185 type:complete len:283 (-) Transcript_46101:384-1232(-)